MYKKALTLILCAVSLFSTSCIDKNYDLLNKEIATDVKIEGNSVALPVGSLKPVVLDSLIDVSSIEMLEKSADGVYSITMQDTISVEESIDPINLNIDPFEYSVPVEFDEVNVNDVHIEAVNIEPAKFATPSISLDELNRNLPKLESWVEQKFDISGLEQLLEQLNNSVFFPDGTYTYDIGQQQVSTGEQVVACSFSYRLPSQVEAIRSIKLGSDNDPKGTLVNVVVNNPGALRNCDKGICFSIEFPEIFHLSKNDAAEQSEKYDIHGHTVVLEDFVPEGDVSVLSFYITEITGLDRYIAGGVINVDDSIRYSIDYKAGGEIVLDKDMTMDDFKYDVELDVQLSFLDVAGKTKDIRVDFRPIEMAFAGDFDNLSYIDTINYVEFDETVSRIKFETSMAKDWLDAFRLKEGYALKISFPEQLDICPTHSVYDGKGEQVVYDSIGHAFYVYDLGILANANWNLALQRLTLNIPVTKDPVTGKGACHMDVNADIRFVSEEKDDEDAYFVLAGVEMESMVEILDKLKGEKEAVFRMSESDLVIKDAVVHTEAIQTSLETVAEFSLNEKIPNEIGRIENIGFENDVLITMSLDVAGLEELNTDVALNANISLPSFLKLKTFERTPGIEINDGLLTIDTRYNPSNPEPLELKLLCTGMDFMNEEFGFNGLLPKDSIDGNSYISYSCDIVVDGEATVYGTEFHSTVLNNDIAFNIEFVIEEISVKTFHGIYSADIDGVEETVELDLGDELAFLREDENTITLADPQLEFVLTNPIGIPVDVDLHICGNDENGLMIPESEIVARLSILPAEYDAAKDELVPVDTRLFITTDTSKIKKAGYCNIELPNLANLLKRIPYSVNLKVEPIIRTDATHHVDISRPIKIDADYSVVVPLKFEDLHLCYNDTISGLDTDLGETLDMFSNVSLRAKMDIVNTIPLGLSLNVVPLDANGEVIEDIEISELVIASGKGENLLDENNVLNEGLSVQNFDFVIKSESGDVSSLDGLVFSIEAASNHTTGAVGLKGEQGVRISNIVFEVSGDIEVDFGK